MSAFSGTSLALECPPDDGVDAPPPGENETFRAESFFSGGETSRTGHPDEALLRPEAVVVPLRQWIRDESSMSMVTPTLTRERNQSVIRRTTFAYAISELLLHLVKNRQQSSAAAGSLRVMCGLENFKVRLADDGPGDSTAAIEGAEMIFPDVSLHIITPFFLRDDFFETQDDGMACGGENATSKKSDESDRPLRQEELGQFLEVEIETRDATEHTVRESHGHYLLLQQPQGKRQIGQQSQQHKELQGQGGLCQQKQGQQQRGKQQRGQQQRGQPREHHWERQQRQQQLGLQQLELQQPGQNQQDQLGQQRLGHQGGQPGQELQQGQHQGHQPFRQEQLGQQQQHRQQQREQQPRQQQHRLHKRNTGSMDCFALEGKLDVAAHRTHLSSSEEAVLCHQFGILLYELYSGRLPLLARADEWQEHREGEVTSGTEGTEHAVSTTDDSENSPGPVRKKSVMAMLSFRDEGVGGDKSISTAARAGGGDGGNSRGTTPARHAPLRELGFPSSLSTLVEGLLACGLDEVFRPDDAMPSLRSTRDELHLLLQDPRRFLFDEMEGGPVPLDIKRNKLYGRDAERSLITDIFCRVSLTGESEVLLVEGFSGSGKSKLVQSVLSYVEVTGGYVVQKKFDQISQERPMSVVLAAFNDLCPLIRKKNSPRELKAIIHELMAVFGPQLSILFQVLPKFALLSPDLDAASRQHPQATEINLNRVRVILKLFMRVVSSKSHPFLLFLDDLHWADESSLDVLQYILSDMKGSSCIFFIGSFRSNEMPKVHPIFRFTSSLEICNVQLSRVHLDGMGIEDVNHMVSDALGLFPRICMQLSNLVLRRTKGNPLFILEFLRSLVDRSWLHYSFRERRWIWDIDKVASEDIGDNVCGLFMSKMTCLPESTQMALKIASCFGSAVNSATVRTLMSASANFSNLENGLESLVKDGFLDWHDSDSSYRFIHDKIREAAYSIIPVDGRDEFRYEIGMILYHAMQGQNDDSLIFLAANQINQGAICDPRLRLKIAELNYRAASKAMGHSNNVAAYFYSSAAAKLLPEDHWEHHHNLSLDIFLVLGNAAYNDGHNDEALRVLNEIILRGRSLKEKVNAYHLKISLLRDREHNKQAYDMCKEVLEALGESISSSIDQDEFKRAVKKIQPQLEKMNESDLVGLKAMDSSTHVFLVQFYNRMCFLAYFVDPPMMKWCAARAVELSLDYGVCKHTALSIMNYASILGGKSMDDIDEGYRIGKMALKLSERFDAIELLPAIYLSYYNFVAVHIEPFQSCADMLKRGLEIGLSTGDAQAGVWNGVHFTQKSLLSGMNLPDLKRECDYQMRLIDSYSRPVCKIYMSSLQETISMLITKEAHFSSDGSGYVARVKDFSESLTFHHVLQSFWLGHYDRCIHYSQKSSALSELSQLKSIMIIFYGGLSCFHASGNKKSRQKLMKTAKKAIEVMREKRKKSNWNYANKVQLLEAEMQAITKRSYEAKISFNCAIASARSAKFIHEEGLACELAALYYLKCGDREHALNLLKQARECYANWGSQVKVCSITERIDKLVL